MGPPLKATPQQQNQTQMLKAAGLLAANNGASGRAQPVTARTGGRFATVCLMMAKTFIAIGVCLVVLGSASSVLADSDNAEDSLAGGLLAGGLFPPELLAGSSLRKVFSPAPDMSDALKGFQTFLGASAAGNDRPDEAKVEAGPTMAASAQDTPMTAAVPPSIVNPMSMRMMQPFPFPSLRSILRKMQASPISVQVIPLGHMSSIPMPKPSFSLSRPMQSLRSLASLPMFSTRSVTITRDGTKTVREETSRDADGNIVTTTTTTTRTPSAPNDAEPASMPEMRVLSSSQGSSELMNSVLEEMPAELKEIFGIADLALPKLTDNTQQTDTQPAQTENTDADAATISKANAEEESDDEESNKEEEKSSSEPFIVEFGDVSLDSASKKAVLDAVAEELKLHPSQLKVADADSERFDSEKSEPAVAKDASVRAWEAAASTAVETAHHSAGEDEVEAPVTEDDDESGTNDDDDEYDEDWGSDTGDEGEADEDADQATQDDSDNAQSDADSDEESDEEADKEAGEEEEPATKQSIMQKLQALQDHFAAVN